MEQELIAAQTAAEQQDYPLALQQVENYLRHARHDGRGWELLGLVLSARGEHPASVSALEQASLFIPLKPVAQVYLALGYGKIGRVQLSRELLEELFRNGDLSAELLVQVAVGLDAAGASELAMHACRKAASIDPELAQPYYDLGYYSAKCGRPPTFVISLARRAISLEPLNVTYRIGLASLLIKLSREDEAYQVVKDLTNAQIESIACACCLERIVPLFETSGDYRRSVLCRKQLLLLAATYSESSDREEL